MVKHRHNNINNSTFHIILSISLYNISLYLRPALVEIVLIVFKLFHNTNKISEFGLTMWHYKNTMIGYSNDFFFLFAVKIFDVMNWKMFFGSSILFDKLKINGADRELRYKVLAVPFTFYYHVLQTCALNLVL